MSLTRRVGRLLDSKVARRMVGLFVACALGPMAALAVMSYVQVSGQLQSASLERRHQASKSVGMDVMGLLRRVESELTLVSSTMQRGPDGHPAVPAVVSKRLNGRFLGVAVQQDGRTIELLAGSAPREAALSARERQHLANGKTVLQVDRDGRLTMIQAVTAIGADLVADLSPESLWGTGDLAPPTMQLLVLGPEGQTVLPPASGERPVAPDALVAGARQGGLGEVEWTAADDHRLGSYWTIPLGFDFNLLRLTVFVSEPRSVVMAALTSGRTPFILVSVATLWCVLLLALVQVKQSLIPLNQLKAGTRRLSAGDFDNPVIVTSGDEFEELAFAFNSMTGQLKRQFGVLSARAALDRAVLSSLDEGTILATALQRLPELVACESACVVTFANDTGEQPLALVSVKSEPAPRRLLPTHGDLSMEEAGRFQRAVAIPLERSQGVPVYAEPLADVEWSYAMAFPLHVNGKVTGVLTVATDSVGMSPEDEVQLRRLADQIAVAMSNARLVGALDRLNVGTLQALARTVDAKSPWTAGHSQRVATMAADLGRVLSVGATTIEVISRGSLLHDIGKIAVPSAILNKPARLTEEEYAVMKEHPRTGARILEPIPEYRRLVPIVLQHHEWFDGSGYPDGLTGEQISFEARIVTVADVFDAVTSKRPYRDGLGLDRSIRIIRSGSGTQFDPEVVRAFMSLMDGRARLDSTAA